MKKLMSALVALVLTLAVNAREYKDLASAQGAQINRVGTEDISIELPEFIFSYTNTKITVHFKNPMHDKLVSNGRRLNFIVNGTDRMVEFDAEGNGVIPYTFKGDNKLAILFEDASFIREVSVISIWYMILPIAGLLLFLGYKIAFSRRKLKVVSTNQEATVEKSTAGNLKVVEEESEVLV